MSNEGLRRKVRDEKHSFEARLSSAADAGEYHDLSIELAVRKRAEAIFREKDTES